jgi:hypothetical protein
MPGTRDIPPGPVRLDLGLDAILEDDGDRGGAGLAPARLLGQAALDEAEFMSAEKRRRLQAATPGPVEAAAPRVQIPRPRRGRLPLLAAGCAALLAVAVAVVALLT